MTSPFDPIQIGPLKLENRLAMAPVKTGFGSTTGEVTDALIAYVRRRARGGVGLLISEPFYVDQRGKEHPKQLGLDTDDKKKGVLRLVEAIHHEGAKVFAHLNHAGRAANPKVAGGPPEAPSEVVCSRTGVPPVALSEARIEEIVRRFAEASARAKEIGFDGVELQFGLGYLVSQFLSPACNQRTDSYGGSPENRARFAKDVFHAVREALGADFPIGVRISGSEQIPNGLGIEDAISLSQRLQAWGASLVHVATGSNCESLPWYFQHMALPSGINETLAAQIRTEIVVPVMAAGRLGDPARLREVFAAEMVDMVALGRSLIVDPDLPKKMRENQDESVRLCGHCLQGCFAKVKAGKNIGCNVNPEIGHEGADWAKTEAPKRVAIIGGGPAGLQAAITAADRGHRVTLFEKDAELGGQMRLAARAPHKSRMEKPLGSLADQVRRSTVTLHLDETATAETVNALKPDIVLVATGSKPTVPKIPGLGDPITGHEVLSGARTVGNDVLVLGGGMIGLEVAEHLAKQKKRCVVVERLEAVATDMDPISRKLLLKRLDALSVEIHTQTELARVDEDRSAVVKSSGEERRIGPFKDFIVSVGVESFAPLLSVLGACGVDVRVIGDAEQPGQIFDAVQAGYRAAMDL